MKIIIDLDDTICEPGWMALINKFLNTNYTYSDIKDFYLDSIVPTERKKEWWDYFLKDNTYDYAEFFVDCFDVLKRLNENNDIYICSATVNPSIIDESGLAFKQKYDFLRRNLPFLDPNKYIFTNDKGIVNGDVIIDDSIRNLSGNIPTKLLYTAYRNENISDQELKEKGIIRVNNWKEIEEILNSLNN